MPRKVSSGAARPVGHAARWRCLDCTRALPKAARACVQPFQHSMPVEFAGLRPPGHLSATAARTAVTLTAATAPGPLQL